MRRSMLWVATRSVLVVLVAVVALALNGGGRAAADTPAAQPPPPATQQAQAGTVGTQTVNLAGKTASGEQLFNIRAEGADLVALLNELLQRAGTNYALSQDISTTVTVSLDGVTLDKALRELQRTVNPAITVKRDKNMVAVQRAPVAQRSDETLAMGGSADYGAAGMRRATPKLPGVSNKAAPRSALSAGSNSASFGGNQQAPVPLGVLNNANGIAPTVTLEVGRKSPIPLVQVLQTMGLTTNTRIMVDPRISSNVLFDGRITGQSLSSALQIIGQTAGLKTMINGDGSLTVAPADEFRLFWANPQRQGFAVSYPGEPAQLCGRCGQPVLSAWNFCPNCGQPVPKTLQQFRAMRQGVQNRGGFGGGAGPAGPAGSPQQR